MSEYRPDKWEIVKIQDGDEEPVYKVMGGWSGSYLDSDSWRLSSGLDEVTEDGDYYLMKNASGSVYKCHKNMQGFTSLSGMVYSDYANKAEGTDVKISTVSVEEYLKETSNEE
jgi:hypothetical protein